MRVVHETRGEPLAPTGFGPPGRFSFNIRTRSSGSCLIRGAAQKRPEKMHRSSSSRQKRHQKPATRTAHTLMRLPKWAPTRTAGTVTPLHAEAKRESAPAACTPPKRHQNPATRATRAAIWQPTRRHRQGRATRQHRFPPKRPEKMHRPSSGSGLGKKKPRPEERGSL